MRCRDDEVCWVCLCHVGDDTGVVDGSGRLFLFMVRGGWVTWAGCCGVVAAIVGGLRGGAVVSRAGGAYIEKRGCGWGVLRFLVWGRIVETCAFVRIVVPVMVSDVVCVALSGGWEGCLAE